MADENIILFQGELQMLAWGESMQAGAWVKFQVHPDDLESFKMMRAKVGKTPGQRMGAVMVQINDDETVEEQPTPKPAAAPKPPAEPMGDVGMRAVLWCRDPRFQHWVATQLLGDADSDDRASEADCKAFILDESGVTVKYGAQASRKHIDKDPECQALFHRHIRAPYNDFFKAKGYQP